MYREEIEKYIDSFSLFSSIRIVTLNLTKAITKEEAMRKKRFLLGAVALT